MKHYLIFGFCLLVTLVSCEKTKEIESSSDETLHEVTFDLSGFSRQIVGINGTTKMSGSGKLMSSGGQQTLQSSRYAINSLHYFVYNGNRLISQKHQYRFDPNSEGTFGVIKDELPVGNYQVVFTAAYNNADLHDTDNYREARIGACEAPCNITDLFHKQLDFQVRETTRIDSVNLERIVGNIEIRLTDDEIPENIRTVLARYNTVSSFYFNEFHDETEYEESLVAGADDDGRFQREKIFEGYAIPYRDRNITTNIVIYGIDLEGQTVTQRIIEDVEIVKNKKTILTGSLFSGANTPSSQEFQVSVDSIYTEIDTIGF